LFTLDAKTVADGMEKIDVAGQSYDQMAENWVNANETVWRGWLR
jgi:ABC-type proline/glycine betaine transport system substrate-binding protein